MERVATGEAAAGAVLMRLGAMIVALWAGAPTLDAQTLLVNERPVTPRGAVSQRSAPTPSIPLAPGTVLRLEGRSTLGGWACTGSVVQTRVNALRAAAIDGGALGELIVPVDGLDCGDRRMEADLNEALRSEQHPRIVVRVHAVRIREQQGALAGRATATIAMAGAERPVEVEVVGRRTEDGGLSVAGRIPLRMTDFGISPPSGLFGLIRAHDQVLVRFDLRATPAALERLGIDF